MAFSAISVIIISTDASGEHKKERKQIIHQHQRGTIASECTPSV
jgi:glycerol-3-phosphate cytidylyltransferase-like family protein